MEHAARNNKVAKESIVSRISWSKNRNRSIGPALKIHNFYGDVKREMPRGTHTSNRCVCVCVCVCVCAIKVSKLHLLDDSSVLLLYAIWPRRIFLALANENWSLAFRAVSEFIYLSLSLSLSLQLISIKSRKLKAFSTFSCPFDGRHLMNIWPAFIISWVIQVEQFEKFIFIHFDVHLLCVSLKCNLRENRISGPCRWWVLRNVQQKSSVDVFCVRFTAERFTG